MIIHSTPWSLSPCDQHLIDLALTEDLSHPYVDLTSRLPIFPKCIQTMRIISKHPDSIILAGLAVLPAIIQRISNVCELHTNYRDSDCVSSQTVIATLSGPAQHLLTLERTLLNFLQRLCGIATLTARFVKEVAGTSMKILDTRKTTPGMRHLEKYAVQCGGGINHRMGLYDAIMVKDTHIDLAGGIDKVLAHLPILTLASQLTVVEVRNISELRCVLSQGIEKVHRVLLDNMSLSQLREAVALCDKQLVTEASGNISLDNVRAIAETGVNFASIGKITHSAPVVDLSMQCDRG